MEWLTAIAALLGGLMNGNGGGSSASGTSGLTPYQQALLNKTMETQQRRVISQNPLYEMATSLAQALMPRSATQTGYLQRPSEPLIVNEPDESEVGRPKPGDPGHGREANSLNGSSLGYNFARTPTGTSSNNATAQAIQNLASRGFGSGSVTGPTLTGTRGITVNTPATLLSRERLMR
jgi:hypothetical protein